MIEFFKKHVIDLHGSTQVVALLRMGLVCLIWSRYALELTPFQYPYRGGTAAGLYISLPFFVSTSLLFIGLFTRFASVAVALCSLYIYYYMGYELDVEPYTHHHTYVLTILSVLFVFLPAGRSLSLDRWLAVRKARRRGQELPSEDGPLWALRLISFQVSMIYLWSAFDKTNAAFLSGERMQHYYMYLYFGSDLPPIPYFELLMQVSAVSAVLLEYALAFTLWIPKLRLPSVVIAVFFHASLYYMLPVNTYTLSMCLCFFTFFPKLRLFPSESFLTKEEMLARQ